MIAKLQGKGMYLWIIDPKDDPKKIAAACAAADLSHVAIKIADAGYAYNVKYDAQGRLVDLVPPLVRELHAYGIQAWGWVFVYGNMPDAEAAIAIKRALELDMDGFIVNAEGQYKGKHASAVRYMDRIRAALLNMPIALSSFRFPDYHPTFPWQEFLSRVDINMPQVYWMLSHNPGDQLRRCVAEFRKSKYPQKPIFPTGAAFSEQGWKPTAGEVQEFMVTAKALGMDGCNFWVYAHAMERFPDLRDVISRFDWPSDQEIPEEPADPVEVPVGVLFYAECTALVRARIRVAPDGAIVGYLDRGLVEPIYGVAGSWYRINRGYVAATLMKKVPSPIVVPEPEPEPEPELTLEEQVDQLQGDMADVKRWITIQDPGGLDA